MGRTGKAGKFHYYCYKGGKKDDIGRIKARGAFAEMGGNDSGMQKQRAVREEVVRRKRNFSDDILSMGACGAEQSGRCNAEARDAGFCRAASAETGVADVSECSATVRIGDGCIEFHQEMSPELIRSLIKALRSC